MDSIYSANTASIFCLMNDVRIYVWMALGVQTLLVSCVCVCQGQYMNNVRTYVWIALRVQTLLAYCV